MVTVVGVRFKRAGKIYYFDPSDIEIEKDKYVIVETARGIEYGKAVIGRREVSEDTIVAPLKKVLRIATAEDETTHGENIEKRKEALQVCIEKIKKHKLEMKIIDVEYTFDNNKVIFYFTADGRIDFRELVKDLAAVFKTRIELRQIGVRDEAKMIGGIGACGKSLCCATWLGDFEPVSIKMAKTQSLSLNPTKISGICGRLMCCLKYENEAYNYARGGLPDVGEYVKTKEGMAKVMHNNILAETIQVRLISSEKGNGHGEKLGDEMITFNKKDVIRKNSNKRNIEEKTDHDELKVLLED